MPCDSSSPSSPRAKRSRGHARRRRVSTRRPLAVRIGTRASPLALRQTEAVAGALRGAWPSLQCQITTITTSGDRDLDRPIPAFGGKGVFTEEIERALLGGEIDLAVHSLKDLPTAQTPGVVIGAVTAREDPADAWIARAGESLERIAAGARVGTSSLRRAAQLRAARPDLRIESIRGNVETRLRKLDEGLFDAIVLARAGLRRVGLESRMTEALPFDVMLPAPGQGAIAIQRREEDDLAAVLLEAVHDRDTWVAVSAERAFLAALEAGCSAPVGALARLSGERLEMSGVTAAADGSELHRVHGVGDPESPGELGSRLAGEARRLSDPLQVSGGAAKG